MQYTVQQNVNKQQFTINSGTPSNSASRTLEAIYRTFYFVLSVWSKVNLDVHPCGLDHISEHPCATKITQRLTEWCVTLSMWRRTLYLEQSLTIVVLGRIHALTMVSNVSAEQSATGARHVHDCCLTPIKTHAITCNRPQFHFCLLKHLSCISTNLKPPPPHPMATTIKISSKEQIKMKFDIALQQNY